MSNPQVHAERSAKCWGGTPEDYLAIHRWFDATKAHIPDNRHRMVLHNGFGIALAEQVFGIQLVNSGGKRVFVRDVGEQHVLEDLGLHSIAGRVSRGTADTSLDGWCAQTPSGHVSPKHQRAPSGGGCSL